MQNVIYHFDSPSSTSSTSPTLFKTTASSKSPKAGSPIRENAIAPQGGPSPRGSWPCANGLVRAPRFRRLARNDVALVHESSPQLIYLSFHNCRASFGARPSRPNMRPQCDAFPLIIALRGSLPGDLRPYFSGTWTITIPSFAQDRRVGRFNSSPTARRRPSAVFQASCRFHESHNGHYRL